MKLEALENFLVGRSAQNIIYIKHNDEVIFANTFTKHLNDEKVFQKLLPFEVSEIKFKQEKDCQDWTKNYIIVQIDGLEEKLLKLQFEFISDRYWKQFYSTLSGNKEFIWEDLMNILEKNNFTKRKEKLTEVKLNS